jgi:spore germination protein GerM
MFRRTPVAMLLVLVLVAACGAPAASPSPSPSVSGSQTPSILVPTSSASAPAPTVTPTPTPTLVPATPSPTVAPPTPSPTPTTMIVRAYFLVRDNSGGEVVNEPTLVPVLRTVPKSTAAATAAMKALLAGPSARERAPKFSVRSPWPIKTLIPAGTKLLGIEISGGLATVDLSAEFASFSADDAWDSGMFELRGRLAQVVYTMTQFANVDRVNFKLEGKPVKVLFGMPDPEDGSSTAITLNKPVTRATYRDHYLPMIFVDRPAWGAALLNPGRVTGLANVFEAQFRMALLDRNDKVLVDVPVLASCGTGCWGTFDVTLRYHVSTAQWGTLRVWDISEYSGRPVAVREYPVYLRPAP